LIIEEAILFIKERNTNVAYLIQDITFYKIDEEGNEVLNEDGTTKIYRIKKDVRVKALEYLTEDFDDDMMIEEDKYHG
jgi:hypothetical protein